MKHRYARLMPVSARPSQRAFALSVAVATVGVGLMYQFLLPQLLRATSADAAGAPALTQLAIAAGPWWLAASLLGGGAAAWLMRQNASDLQSRLARPVLQLLLAADTLMVGVSLAGFYASIVAMPQGYG